MNPIELAWGHKALRPVAQAGGYTWVSVDDARVVRPLITESSFGVASTNLLIVGDATDALPALTHGEEYRALYAGKVKLCYIDPPFNTGETFEHYSDRIESSEWLGILREHLLHVRQLLAPDGSVWVHLDDSEQHRARCVLDEVFGADSFVATVIWQKRTSRDNRKAFSSMHDYIHIYAPAGPVAWKRVRNGVADTGTFTNPDGDPRGPWRSAPMSVQAGHATASQFYTVVTPTGVRHDPPPGRCWTFTVDRLTELDADGRVYWPRGGDGKPRLKRYQSEAGSLAPFTIWGADEVGDNSSAKKALRSAFPGVPTFDTPKPEALLERIVSIATDPGDLVLDCYLGSGTTAVAAAQTGRRWLGIERNRATVLNFAERRLKKAAAAHASGFTVARI